MGRAVFNIAAKYILIAKEIKSNLKVKYIISDLSGKTRKISEEDTINMAKNSKLANCTFDNRLKGIGMTLRHLPIYNKNTGENYREGKEQEIIDDVIKYKYSKTYYISRRIMVGKQCIGYELQGLSGQTGSFKRDTVITMIQLGYIPTASYQYYDNTHFIKGIGFNINKIESIRVEEGDSVKLI